MNRRIIPNGFLLVTRRSEYLAASTCGALILDLFDYILSSREISWFQIDYNTIKIELNNRFSLKTIQRNIQSLEDKKLILSQVFKNKQKKYSLNYELINSFEIPNKFSTCPNVQTEVKMTRGQNDQRSNCPEPQVKLSSGSGQNDSSDYIYKIQNTSFNTDQEQKNKKKTSQAEEVLTQKIKMVSHQSTLNEINQDLKTQPITPNEDQFSPDVDFTEDKNKKSALTKWGDRELGNWGDRKLERTTTTPNTPTPQYPKFGDWIPDGPWLKISESGRRYLDHAFVEYRAKKFFVKNWGDELPEAISKTIKYYRNDIERLAIDWEEYHRSTLAIAANIQAYTRATGEIKQADVQKLASISSAFQSLPENLQSTDKKPEFKPIIAQTSENVNLGVENSKMINTTYKPIPPAKNPPEYLKMTPIDQEATPEQKTVFFNALHQMFGTSKHHPSEVKKQQVKSRLEILNQNL